MKDDLISKAEAVNMLRMLLVRMQEGEPTSDLIRRQDAIDACIDKGQASTRYKIGDFWELNGQEIREALNAVPSAQPKEWIPCSEKLPEVSGRYLVTRGLNACGTMWDRVYIINYSDLKCMWWNGIVGKSDFEFIGDVVAWMPLPEPYKEGED